MIAPGSPLCKRNLRGLAALAAEHAVEEGEQLALVTPRGEALRRLHARLGGKRLALLLEEEDRLGQALGALLGEPHPRRRLPAAQGDHRLGQPADAVADDRGAAR